MAVHRAGRGPGHMVRSNWAGGGAAAQTLQQLIAADTDLLVYVPLNETVGASSVTDAKTAATYTPTSVTFGSASSFVIGSTATMATFDGTASKVVLGDLSALNFDYNTPWTITARVRPNLPRTGTGNVRHVIYDKKDSATGKGLRIELRFNGTTGTYAPSVEAVVWLDNAYSTASLRVRGGGFMELPNSNEFILTVTYDGTGTFAYNQTSRNGLQIYANATPSYMVPDPDFSSASQTLLASTTVPTAGTNAVIGQAAATGTEFYKGDIADLAVFSTCKSASWVRSLVSAARPYTNAYTPYASPRPQVIYDLDFDSDSDDISDFAAMCGLVKGGEADLAAVIVTSSRVSTCGSVYAVLNYYGLTSVPVGVCTSDGGNAGTDVYNGALVTFAGVAGHVTSTDFPSSTTVIRQALHDAADGSIAYVTTGGLTAISDALDSAADGIDARSGQDLASAKMRAFFPCAGYWPSGSAISDASSTKTQFGNTLTKLAAGNVPVWLTDLGSLGGSDVETGTPIMYQLPSNPLRKAWELKQTLTTTAARASWSGPTIVSMIRGMTNRMSAVAAGGTATVNGSTGVTSWSPTPASTHGVLQRTMTGYAALNEINQLASYDGDPATAAARHVDMLLAGAAWQAANAAVTPTEKAEMVALLTTLLTYNFFQKCETFVGLNMPTVGETLIDWKTGLVVLTDAGACLFQANRGRAGDGTAGNTGNAYLRHLFKPSNGGLGANVPTISLKDHQHQGVYVSGSFSGGVRVATDVTSATAWDCGNSTNFINSHSATTSAIVRQNASAGGGSTVTLPSSNGGGHILSERLSATQSRYLKNGAQIGLVTDTDTASTNSTVTICTRNLGASGSLTVTEATSTRAVQFYHAGCALTKGQPTFTDLTSVGAATSRHWNAMTDADIAACVTAMDTFVNARLAR